MKTKQKRCVREIERHALWNLDLLVYGWKDLVGLPNIEHVGEIHC
jgi:hypothetical protein